MSEQVTFRDYAGAIMNGDMDRAATVLGTLLDVSVDRARAATEHFQTQMKASPAFMMKAMGLRSAVEGGDDDSIRTLLGEIFALDGEELAGAVTAIRARYA